MTISPRFLAAQSLSVTTEADQLHIGAPQLRLLTKDVLDRLHNGASVGLTFHIALSSASDGTPIDQITYRFVFSYDLWEEKFAVTRLEPIPRAISHLSAAAAETWCMDALRIRSDKLSIDRSFWVSLNYQVEPPASASAEPGNSGFTLGGLVDIFSRPSPRQQASGSRRVGPLRLGELRRN